MLDQPLESAVRYSQNRVALYVCATAVDDVEAANIEASREIVVIGSLG